MNKKNYCKKYKISSKNNNYILRLESIERNNQNILYIKLCHKLKDREKIYYIEKTLEEIHKENNYLLEYKSIDSLILYLANLIKKDWIGINKDNNLVYILTFIDKSRETYVAFPLVLRTNYKIENDIFNMYNDLNKMKYKYEEANRELEEIKNKNFINIQNNINNNVNNINNNFNNQFTNNNAKIKNSIYSLYSEDMNEIKTNKENKLNNNINNNINKDYKKNISENGINLFKVHEINIFKENNNTIKYSRIPIGYNKKIILNEENQQCEIFTAFQLPNGHAIITFTIKSRNNEIIIMHLNNDKNKSITKAHKSQINCLQYFHNENIDEKNDYIISLSENDKDILKIWLLLDQKDLEIKLKKNINYLNKKIEKFCMFNNKYYSKENSYLFIYGENANNIINNNYLKNKDIICYKIDNELNLINWNKPEHNEMEMHIDNKEKINYLDTFYYSKNKKIYLINCNYKNVNVIIIKDNPFDDYIKIFFNNNQEMWHINAFIVERNNNLELIELNVEGIYIWKINMNNLSEFQIKINIGNAYTFDMCLWNNDYLWASTSEGYKLIQISLNKNISIEIEKCTFKTYSKIRKIYSPIEGYSIIGLDIKNNLCLWPIICEAK